MKYLNIGCGNRHHPDWINIDIAPRGPDVINHDITKGLPLPDDSCDVVYHSNVLEHIRKEEALPFLKECYRVMKSKGILRVAVPDLEELSRLYLRNLEAAINGDESAINNHEWIMLEMFDQIAREKSGGEMLQYLGRSPLPNEKFVMERIGEEGRAIIRGFFNQAETQNSLPSGTKRSLKQIIKKLSLIPLSLPKKAGIRILSLFLGANNLKALSIGRFRLAGEVHQWMYDRFSLSQLMISAGFEKPLMQAATQSHIPQWRKFNLDTLPDETVIKPDSLYMEAMKP